MKYILTLAILSVVAAIPVVKASAQEERSTVTVPFAFHVANNTLPAGTYTINSSSFRHTIDFSSADYKTHAGTFAMNDSYNNGHANVLVFQKYGSQYFLRRVVRSDVHSALYLSPTKTEKRARHETNVAALPTDDAVRVAMNDHVEWRYQMGTTR